MRKAFQLILLAILVASISRQACCTDGLSLLNNNPQLKAAFAQWQNETPDSVKSSLKIIEKNAQESEDCYSPLAIMAAKTGSEIASLTPVSLSAIGMLGGGAIGAVPTLLGLLGNTNKVNIAEVKHLSNGVETKISQTTIDTLVRNCLLNIGNDLHVGSAFTRLPDPEAIRQLIPLLTMVYVTSSPPGASVSIEGMTGVGGETPCHIPVGTAQEITVHATKDGYVETSMKVTIKQNEVAPCILTMNKLPHAVVNVTSTPMNAAITVDGKSTGKTTPCQIDIVILGDPTREVVIMASLPGYVLSQQKIAVKVGTETPCAMTLKKFPSLIVTSTPPGALITVDGKAMGKTTPCQIDIDMPDESTRDVVVMALMPGYVLGQTKVTMKVSTETPWNITLDKPPVITPGTDIGEERVNPLDGAKMVWVSAGKFLRGSKRGDKSEQPQRKIDLDGFWMYKTEVTVAQYRIFCQATGHQMPKEPRWKWQDDYPIVNVSWEDALTYAQWAGAALPTEAEWEKTARGTDGRVYPWGNEWDACKCVNSTNSGGGAKPVGSFPTGASPYGCLDMAGNVWEWCADKCDFSYYKDAPVRNPTGPATGTTRVVRGGSWVDDDPVAFRAAPRTGFDPALWNSSLGFRCVLRSPGQ